MENILINSNDINLLYSKEDTFGDLFLCPKCRSKSMGVDGDLTRAHRNKLQAESLNNLETGYYKLHEIYVFKCGDSECAYEVDSRKLNIELNSFIQKSDSLFDVALHCNPHRGQTWSTRSGFPTKICKINGNPCYEKLWDVCPHIGNGELHILSKTNLPIVGE